MLAPLDPDFFAQITEIQPAVAMGLGRAFGGHQYGFPIIRTHCLASRPSAMAGHIKRQRGLTDKKLTPIVLTCQLADRHICYALSPFPLIPCKGFVQ